MPHPMSILARLLWVGLFSLTVLFSAAPVSASTSLDVGQVNSHLKRAEANLNLVDGTIGHLTSPPKGSAGKLANMRLGQANGDLEAARKLLEGLTGGAGLPEAKARYAQAAALSTKLQNILSGTPPAPAPKPEPTPKTEPAPKPSPNPTPKQTPKQEPAPEPKAPAPKTVRLGYPHADNFKNTLFTLRRVEGEVAAIDKRMLAAKGVPDPLDVNFRDSAQAVGAIGETLRQAGFVKDGLAKIPSNGEGVAEAHVRLAKAQASLSIASAYFQPLNASLVNLVNPANYPDLHKDVVRLRELSGMYSNPSMLFRDQRVRAAEAWAQIDAAKAECYRLANTYARLIRQRTEQGIQVENAGNNFLSTEAAFRVATAAQIESLPGEIRAELAEADKYAKQAVEEQNPLFFTGGIPQRMGYADEKQALFQALNPSGAAVVQVEVDAMKASIQQRADSLKELIIRENKLPLDRFTGADREAAIAIAKDAWKHQEQEFEVLAVRIPSEAWSRDTKWTYSNGTWYFVDISSIQVRLIVADKGNPELAIDRAINVRKDHQKGDKLYGVPLRSFGESLAPHEYLLRTKIK